MRFTRAAWSVKSPRAAGSSKPPASAAPGEVPQAWLVAVDPTDAVIDRALAYLPPAGWDGALDPQGARVRVPLQQRLVRGWVVGQGPAPDRQLKAVAEVEPPGTWLPPERVELGLWMARTYLCPPGQALAALDGPGLKAAAPAAPSANSLPAPAGESLPLTVHQRAAVDAVGKALATGEFAVFLLWGVTGSGKTRVYEEAARRCLASGRSAVILVPEIALTHQLLRRLQASLGDRVVVVHSQMALSERRRQWQRACGPEPVVLVGPRSAAVAPVPQVGLYVMDEEHETSYKQEEAPRYHAREVVLYRAQKARAVVVLGSATPSLEAFREAAEGRFKLLQLPERVDGRPMPSVEVVDLREELAETGRVGPISRALADALRAVFSRGEQAILFINRRGFAGAILCRECGFGWRCPHCDVHLTYHHGRQGVLRCHYCGHEAPLVPNCPRCGGRELAPVGFGTQKIQAALQATFPGVAVFRLDADTTTRRHAHERILDEFARTFPAVLVGTQMVAKGHDFPRVTLAAAVLADVTLALPDFRAAERTFQQLTQLAGRAGRGALPGRVLVQTFRPEHHSVQAAATGDVAGFYRRELAFRRRSGYPPFTSLVRLVTADPDEERARRAAVELARRLQEACAGSPVRVLGPAPAPIRQLRDRFRWQVMLRGPGEAPRERTAAVLEQSPLRGSSRPESVVVDVDPQSVL